MELVLENVIELIVLVATMVVLIQEVVLNGTLVAILAPKGTQVQVGTGLFEIA